MLDATRLYPMIQTSLSQPPLIFTRTLFVSDNLCFIILLPVLFHFIGNSEERIFGLCYNGCLSPSICVDHVFGD